MCPQSHFLPGEVRVDKFQNISTQRHEKSISKIPTYRKTSITEGVGSSCMISQHRDNKQTKHTNRPTVSGQKQGKIKLASPSAVCVSNNCNLLLILSISLNRRKEKKSNRSEAAYSNSKGYTGRLATVGSFN
jgi:hypothetical protein